MCEKAYFKRRSHILFLSTMSLLDTKPVSLHERDLFFKMGVCVKTERERAACMHAHATHACCLAFWHVERCHQALENWSYRWLWTDTWVLAVKPRSSGRAKSNLNNWAISQPGIYLLDKWSRRKQVGNIQTKVASASQMWFNRTSGEEKKSQYVISKLEFLEVPIDNKVESELETAMQIQCTKTKVSTD